MQSRPGFAWSQAMRTGPHGLRPRERSAKPLTCRTRYRTTSHVPSWPHAYDRNVMTEIASVLAPVVELSVRTGASNTCERCGEQFQRRTNERECSQCLAPLRRLRIAAGLTQDELARRVGCTRPQTIYELERDRYTPALVLAEAIAGVLMMD